MRAAAWTALLLVSLQAPLAHAQASWSGNVTARHWYFLEDPQFDDQPESINQLSGQVEYYHAFESGIELIIEPYARVQTNQDPFYDLREAQILAYGDTWEFRAGVDIVFWGVLEAINLVDVINQSDTQEDFFGDEKLGQPMLHGTWLPDWGQLELFLMPYFRERYIPELGDRPRFVLPADNDAAQFESDDGIHNLDIALRYSQTFDDIDLGVSYFNGTNRDPRLIPQGDVLIPFYSLMEQLSLDLQYTTEAWLWKLEALYRDTEPESFSTGGAGFEYTFVGLFESSSDLGLIGELIFDDRRGFATTPFQNDILTGLRWTLNDEQSTSALLGVISDLDGGGYIVTFEGDRRLGQSFLLKLDGRGFTRTSDDPQLSTFANDDFIRLSLGYFF